VQGSTLAVTAEDLDGPQRDAAWAQIVRAAPRFASYERQTDRLIPVVRLVERG
jgi:hypothetical protein